MDWKYFLLTYSTETLLALCTCMLFYILYREKTKKTPPGPWSIPVFGCIPFSVRTFSPVDVAKLAKTYGKISSLQVGNKDVIFLNDYQTIKETIAKTTNFDEHPQMLSDILRLANTIFASRNEEAISLRRAFLITVKTKTEQVLQNEIFELLNEFQKFGENSFNPTDLIIMFMGNFTSYITFGQRYDYSNDTMKTVISIVKQLSNQVLREIKLLFFPWVYQIPFIGTQFLNDSLQEKENHLSKIVVEKLEELRKSHEDEGRDHFVDSFLTERQMHIKKTGNRGFFTDDKLISNVTAAFKFGADTTGTVLLWLMFLVSKNAHVYDKLKKEILDVIGLERYPDISDQFKMPYAQAVIMEIHRYAAIAPLSPFRCNDNPTEINGYSIPKDSFVTINIWAIHNDPKLWNDPEIFRPERFINNEGQIQKSEYLIPFSIGKRRCPAEYLANTLIFIFLTSLYQKFRIEIDENVTDKSVETVAIKPPPFRMRLILD